MKTRIIISILWLIFAVLFFTLAGLHKTESKRTIPKIKVGKYASYEATKIIRGGVPTEQRLFDFGDDFNKYLDDQDESNRKANLYAFYGYFLAGFVALASLVFEWREYILLLLGKFGFTGDKPKTSKNNK